VERHEHFEALCAAASIGQASGAELAELREHLEGCTTCQQAYSDFLQLGTVRSVADAFEKQEVTASEAIGYIDSALFREKFLKKAEAEGILLSRQRVCQRIREPLTRPAKNRWGHGVALATAASILLALGALGGYWLRTLENDGVSQTVKSADTPAALPSESKEAVEQREVSISHLEMENRKLKEEISALRASLAHESAKVKELQSGAAASEKDRAELLAAAKEHDEKIDDLQRKLTQAQAESGTIQAELEKVQSNNQAALAADQTRIRELTDQLAEQSSTLDREREMLAANRDIRDLMSARNLHIADVFDTDPKGKTRAAFGRVFFTEGKSLIIYAYDLNDHRVQDAGYHYRVWGKKEGPTQQAKSLGIFYSDDSAQKRWVFKYDDPKVLSEIDSVFVTLEPPGKNFAEPKGDKFLYAYLRNQPNHP
jgi:predicted  nucleic acid-binding Zn-ribbon protein